MELYDLPAPFPMLKMLPISFTIPFLRLPHISAILDPPRVAFTTASDNLCNLLFCIFGLNESVLDLLLQFIYVQMRIMIC